MERLSLNDYDKGTTDASFQLLKKFLELMDEKNIQTIIIGGWATEAFQEGIGSKDIDIVMLNDDDVNKLLSENFFDEEENPVQQIYPIKRKKTISVNGKNRTIICDIFSAEYPRDDYEGLGIKIHWRLTQKFKVPRKIRDMPVLVPKRELLIILKIIALVDRSERLDKRGDGDDDENLQSKISKDYRDIAVLVAGQKLDKGFLKKYITESHLLGHMEKFLSRYKQADYKGILDDLGITPQEMETALKV